MGDAPCWPNAGMENTSGVPESSKTGRNQSTERQQRPGTFRPGAEWRGNGNGRPRKGHAMTDILDRLSELPVTELRKLRPAELTTKEAVVRALLLRAYSQAKGHRDRVLMFDRLDGKAHQSVQIIGEGNDLWRELGEEWDDVLKRGMSNAELVAMLDQLDDTPPVDGRGMVGGEA